MWIQQHIC